MFTVMKMEENMSRCPEMKSEIRSMPGALPSLVTRTAGALTLVLAGVFAVGGGLSLSGCGSEDTLPGPVIEGVSPGFRVENVRTPVVITGADFIPLLQIGPQGETKVDARFKLNLEPSTEEAVDQDDAGNGGDAGENDQGDGGDDGEVAAKRFSKQGGEGEMEEPGYEGDEGQNGDGDVPVEGEAGDQGDEDGDVGTGGDEGEEDIWQVEEDAPGDGDEGEEGAEPLTLYDVRYVDKTRLEAVIPKDLEPGMYDLVLVSPLGKTVRMTRAFECRLPPEITGIDPDTGPREGNTPLTITGKNFITGTVVHVGGQPIERQSIKDLTQITGFLPTAETEGVVDVCVTSPYGDEMDESRCLAGGFTYYRGVGDLFIQAVEPNFGPASGGTKVDLYVNNLTGNTRVYVGGDRVQAGLRFNLDEEYVSFTMPAREPGPVSIKVERDDSFHTLEEAYWYEGAPVVDQIDPEAGRSAGGEKITVTGEWLLEGTVVELNDQPLTEVTYSGDGNSLTGYTPRGRGSVTVKVYGRGKVSENQGVNGRVVIANGFTYRGSPQLISISPSLGPQEPVDSGYPITLTGEGFVPGMDVIIGGNRARNVVVDEDGKKATCMLPPGKGIVSVTIATSDGVATLVDAFTYRPPLKVGKIVPRRGWGGEEMVITGDGLSRCNRVLVGLNELGNLSHDGDMVLIGQVPPAVQGPASIRIECGQDGVVIVEGAFTYREPREEFAPERVVPLAGPVGGGNTMWVYGVDGKGLGTDVVVKVGGQPLEQVEFFGESSLRGTVPAGVGAGPVQVEITRWAEQQIWSQPYVYTDGDSDRFDLISIEPNSGVLAGGNLVRLTGTGFSEGMVITVGGKAIQGLVVKNRGEAYGYMPPGEGTSESVVPVFGLNGPQVCPSCAQAYPGGINYTYLDGSSLAVASIYPSAGAEQGGTVFTIQGTGFNQVSKVKFGTQEATAVQVVSTGPEPPYILGQSPVWKENPSTVDVIVELQGGATATLQNGFTYHSDTDLTLADIAPRQGAAGSTVDVALRGSGFTRNIGVTVGGESLTRLNVFIPAGRHHSTQATGRIPAALEAGVHDVIVRDGDKMVTLQKGYCAQGNPPQITAVNPTSGQAAGGTRIQIAGGPFGPNTVVMLDGRPLFNLEVNGDGTVIVGNTPSGSGQVALSISDGCQVWDSGYTFSYSGSNQPSVTDPPIPTVVQPAKGPVSGGTLVVISGANLGQVYGAQLDGVNLNNFVVIDEHTVAGVTPMGSAGTVKLDLMSSGGTGTLNQAFTYLEGSTISRVEPGTGYSRGGDTVRIYCNNLAADARATIGGLPLAETVVNTASGYISGKTPPGLGVVRVEVKSTNGTVVKEAGFTYLAAPEVLSITPAFGPRSGGTTVTVKGRNFPTSDIAIRFGPSLIQARQRIDSETIVGKTPPGWGPVDVTAETFSGMGRLEEAFTYMEPPLITRVIPGLGRKEGNTLVVIEGVNFSENVSFEVDGRSMLPPEPGESNYLGSGMGVGRTPGAATIGPVGVTATESWGSSTKTNGYRYVDQWTRFELAEKGEGPYTAITSCMDGNVWVGMDQGLLRIGAQDDGDLAFHHMKEFGGERINFLNCFRPGVLAVGSDRGMGICSVSEGRAIHCRVVDDLDIPGAPSPLMVRSVNEFAAGRIAGATNGGMLVVLSRGGLGASAVFMVDSRSSLPSNDIRDLAVNDAYTALLATSRGAAIYDFRNGSVLTFNSTGSTIPSDDARSAVVGDGGVFYVGLDQGMAYSEPSTEEGVPRSWDRVTGLPDGSVEVLAADQEGNVWAGLEGGGAARIVDGAVVDLLDESSGLPPGALNSIHVDFNGAVYFVSDGGVSRLAP